MSSISFDDAVFNAAKEYAAGGPWEPLSTALRNFYHRDDPSAECYSCSKPCSREWAAKQVKFMEGQRATAAEYKVKHEHNTGQ